MSFGNPYARLTAAEHEKAREIAAIFEGQLGPRKAPQFAALVLANIERLTVSTGPNLCSEIMLPRSTS